MRFINGLLLLLVVSPAVMAAGETISYDVNGKPYEGYYTSSADNAPLVLLIHDWDGLTDYEIKRADMLAELGYAVFAVDLFGAGVRPTEDTDKRQHTGALYKDRSKMRDLLNAGLLVAQSHGGNIKNAIVIGYCFGGAAVLEFARSGANLNGFVTFHGGLSTPAGQNYSKTKGKVLVFHGSADSAITMNDFAELANALEQASVAHEMTSYGGAPHAFTVFGSDRYREEADKQSWQRFIKFLEETL